MNHTYRVIWNCVLCTWQAVAETARGRGKSKSVAASLLVLGGLLAGLSPALAQSVLPTGGNVVAGNGSIATAGSTMTVTQSTARMAVDWQSFSIGAGNTVQFVQPSASAVALNRVIGSDVSVIQGALRANGQVFLINPNGVLFTPTAQVNTAGIVASTLNLSNSDFMAGNYRFAGSSSNAIVNQGNITVAPGGTVAMIAAKITNTGRIEAPQGQVLMGAGQAVTLDLGGPVKIEVTQGAIDALIRQGGAIKADGGLVYLTAKAAGDLASTVINHTGITEAQTLATGEQGQIYLMGGMDKDRIEVGGTLDASAPNGGNGGFIETSAAQVQIQDGVRVSTVAPVGRTGEWLIDPADITIAASGGNVTGSALATALQTTSVTLDTSGSGNCTGVSCSGLGGTDGDIIVNDNINVTGGSADTTLTLKANRNIFMNAGKTITRTDSSKLDVVFWADSDASGGGAIWLGKGNTSGSSIDTTISTNGGNITLSGGSDVTTGYAEGVNGIVGNGVTLDRAQLVSAGGNIVIRGRSSTTNTSIASTDAASSGNTNGIRLHGGNTIDAGNGTISLTGIARGTNGSSNGIETNFVGYSKVLSSSTSANAISFFGDATAGTSTNGWGTFLWGTNTSGIVLAATGAGGGIKLDGLGRSVSGGGGTHLEPNTFVLAASGPIDISGTKGAASTYEGIVINSTVGFASSLPAGFGVASPVTASSSNISLTTDTLSANRVFGGGAFTGSAVQSSGTLTIAPRTSSKALSVRSTNPGGSVAWINPNSMFGASGLFKAGFSKLVFGSATTGDVTLDNFTFNNDTEIVTSGNATLGAITIADDKSLTVDTSSGSGSITDTGTLTIANLKLNGGSSAVTLDSAANAIGKISANVDSLNLSNNAALEIGTVAGLSGVTASGKINVATISGNLTLDGNVQSGSTASDAIVLNAGRSAAAGTATGGNIIHTSGTVSTGSGGRSTFFTGSVSGSTGLTALLGSGSGRFRYNSDEAATGYDTSAAALGSGAYAVYRERPTVTATASNASITTAQTPYNGGNGASYAGFVNGDTGASLSGTLTYSGSSQGATAAGTYTITPGGLSSGLGYALAYADGTLTISAATPASTTSSTDSASSSSKPRSAAVETAQQTTVTSNSTTGTTASRLAASQVAVVPASAPGAGRSGPVTIGSLEVVAINTPAATTGNASTSSVAGGASSAPAPADRSTSGNDSDGSNAPGATQVTRQTDPNGLLKVFVMNGGINLPGAGIDDGL